MQYAPPYYLQIITVLWNIDKRTTRKRKKNEMKLVDTKNKKEK